MPAFIYGAITLLVGAIVKALVFIAGFLLFKLLLLMGFSYVIYKGMDAYIFSQYDKIKGLFGQIPDFVVVSLALLNFDVYISILISAMILRFSIDIASRMTFFRTI